MKYPEKIASKTVVEKYGRKVALDTFKHPDGHEDEWLLFSSSKTPVIVFPLTADFKVVAVRQYRYGAGEPVLELPGGLIEEPATVAETAQRELNEEAGYHSNDLFPINPHGVWFDPCCYSEKFLVVLALDCEKVEEPTEPYTEADVVPLDEWYYTKTLEVCLDSKTLAVSLMVLPYLRKLCGKKVAKAVRKAVGLK